MPFLFPLELRKRRQMCQEVSRRLDAEQDSLQEAKAGAPPADPCAHQAASPSCCRSAQHCHRARLLAAAGGDTPRTSDVLCRHMKCFELKATEN